ncbi:MAG: tetratricopeptide repeat protein [Actinomycetes bacterium]
MPILRRPLAMAGTALGLALLLLTAALVGGVPGGTRQGTVAPRLAGGATAPFAGALASAASLPATIDALQEHLRAQPKDARSWATLGLAYVEQARLSSDPAFYPKAVGALDRSLALEPRDNDAALLGLSALASGRHDFVAAESYAQQALAVNPDSAAGYGALSDALTELGKYSQALSAARTMDRLRPGLPSLARLSYQAELRGDLAGARRLFVAALAQATDPADVAFVRQQLGDLAWAAGSLPAAEAHYRAALRAEPGHVGALFGRSRVAFGQGETATALELAGTVAQRRPTVEHVVWYGELLESVGRTTAAADQYGLARIAVEVQRAAGVAVDLEIALYEADHGDPMRALAAAEAAYAHRPSVFAADAYAWALHVSGMDRRALRYADEAARQGSASTLFAAHRGMIERSLGMDGAARRDLRLPLRLNPHFSPVLAPLAERALASM